MSNSSIHVEKFRGGEAGSIDHEGFIKDKVPWDGPVGRLRNSTYPLKSFQKNRRRNAV
jgi:hypothetical protein